MLRRRFAKLITNEKNYLAFKALDNTCTISLSYLSLTDIKYKINNGDWILWTAGSISFGKGDIVYMKGNNPDGFTTNSYSLKQFTINGSVSSFGNIMSLLYEDNFENLLIIPSSYCFHSLFLNCTNLTTAPELPAIELKERCYLKMFLGCTNLKTAPELPAKTLTGYCYYYMFYGCTKLNYIKMLATNIDANACMTTWVSNVASTGTFVKSIEATWNKTGTSGVPRGWDIKYDFTITSCISLSIIADDVSYDALSTTIYYTALVEGINEKNIIELRTIQGKTTSNYFLANDTDQDIIRTITFTYYGVTATTEIILRKYQEAEYIINLNNLWQLSTVNNPDSSAYDGVYESYSNYNLGDTPAIMYITLRGYSNFKLYIRSDGESNYDYVMVSLLDKTIDNNTSYDESSLVKGYAIEQNSGYDISDYILIEFTDIDTTTDHVITIIYRKDFSYNEGTDKGYILIPYEQ